MKKILLLLVCLVLPIIVFAESGTNYTDSVHYVNNYIHTFEKYNSYLHFKDKLEYVYEDGAYSYNPDFKSGGLLSKTEYEISNRKNNTWLSNGLEYWTSTKSSGGRHFVLNYRLQEKLDTAQSGVRVTEYVKKTSAVVGAGSYADPWQFTEVMNLYLNSTNIIRGQVSTVPCSDTSMQKETITLTFASGNQVEAYICPASGYTVYTNSCSGYMIKDTNNKYIISGVSKDNLLCNVSFTYTTTQVNLACPNCTTNPSPSVVYSNKVHDLWFSNKNGLDETKITKLTTNPTKTGYTYKGYYKDGTLIINTSGVFQDDATALINGATTLNPTFEANKYEVKLDVEDPDEDNEYTPEIDVRFDDQTPEVIIPKRFYLVTYNANGGTVSRTQEIIYHTFDGYFYNGVKYINADGTSARKWDIAQDVTLKGQWSGGTISFPTASRTGYKLLGWYTSDGTKIENGSVVTKNLSLKAKWEAIDVNYTVKHYQENIDGSYATPTVETFQAKTDSTVTPAVKTYTGFDSPSTQSTVVNGAGDTVIEYRYKRKKYTVSISKNNTNYGTIDKPSLTIKYGTTYSSSGTTLTFNDGQKVTATITNVTGYTTTFSNWSPSSGTITGATTITANFARTPIKYTYTFTSSNASYGTVDKSSVSVAYDSTYSVSGNVFTFSDGQKVTATATAKTGYTTTFGSWSSTSGTVKGAATITANFSRTANTYTIAYNCNTGSGSTASSSHTYDSEKTLTTNGCTKTGYKFSGWNTKSDGSGTSYSNGASVSNLSSTKGATVTLYAKWTPITYYISFSANGGSGTMANMTVKYDQSVALTSNAFSKTGHKYEGWSGSNGTNYSNGATIKNLTTTDGATITMTARWTKCESGTYLSGNTCTPCPAGSYCTAGVNSATSCPSGYTSAAGATAQSSCYISVSAGKYIGTAKSSTQSTCAAGTYKTAHTVYYGSTSSCSDCPSGYTSASGATAQTSCYISVSAGKYIGTAKSSTQSTCAAGTYKEAHKVNYGSTSSCSPCPSGYTSATGATAQNKCYISVDAGYYLGSANGTTKTKCAAGTYKVAHTVNYGSTSSCSPCPSGYTSATGATAQTSCYISVDAGYYLGSANGTTKTKCATGTYKVAHTVNYGSTSSCSTCPSGYTSATGATAQSSCYISVSAGKYIGTAKSSTQSTCAAGTYKESHTVNYGSTSSCSSCPSGYTSDSGATAQNKCYISVSGGKYIGTAKSSSQSTCAAGTYKAAHKVNYGSTSSCTACESCKTSSAGASSCTTITYTVSYSANGGSGAPSNQTKTCGTALTLSSTKPTRSGYTFTGWKATDGTSYAAGASYTANAATTMTAQWKDSSAPTCKLQAVNGTGVTFQGKSDNVGVTEFGIIKSTSPTYNGVTSIAFAPGVYYGYVKDAAGNTGSCSLTIASTVVSSYSKTTKTCNRSVSNYTKTTKTCNRSVANYTKTTKKCNRNVANYTLTMKVCNRSVSNYTKTQKYCGRSLSSYTRTTKTCSRSVSNYTKTTKTCNCSYNGGGSCTCTPTSYIPNNNTNIASNNSNTALPNASNQVAYSIGVCTTSGCSCGGGAKVRTNDCTKTCSFGSSSSSTVSSCTSNAISCTTSNSGKTYVGCSTNYSYSFSSSTSSVSSCTKGSSFTCNSSNYGGSYISDCSASYSYSLGSASSSTVSSCTANTFTCNSSNYGSYYTTCSTNYTYSFGSSSSTTVSSCTAESVSSCNSSTYQMSDIKCSTNYSYSFGSASSSTVDSCTANTFACDSSNYGNTYTSCSTNYSYSFGSNTSTATSCSTESSFTCNSSNYGSSYVSGCTPNYGYSFGSSTSTASSCSIGSSFTCNSSNYGSSYVSGCTPAAYSCSSGYTKINDSYCYK